MKTARGSPVLPLVATLVILRFSLLSETRSK